ncbi:MAG: hypothetical protein R2881_05635 [Eubacteriales bacterium]
MQAFTSISSMDTHAGQVAKKLNINKNTLSQRFVRIRSKLVKRVADQSLFFALMVLFLLKPR